MKRRPAGYLRRSSADAKSPGAFSRTTQEDAVRALATIDGHASDLELYVDWGLSGGKLDRPDYQRLRGDIVAGAISHVYALNLSRIGRSLSELIAFADLCRDHDTALVLAKDPVNTTTASGRMLYSILGSVAQFTRELAAEGQAAALQERLERGDKLGRAHYGMKLAEDAEGRVIEVRDESVDLEPIRRAYDDAGTVLGAVRRLNERGIVGPRGGTWHVTPLRRVLGFHWPELLDRQRRGPNGKSMMVLKDLLVCHCGHKMTANQARGQFYCYAARGDAKSHGKAHIKEAYLLPWVADEAGRLVDEYPEVDIEDDGPTYDDRDQRAALEAMRGTVADATIDAALSDLDAARAAHGGRARRPELLPPPVDWERWTAENINRVLRTQFRYIELGPDLLPIRAEWVDPAWRRP